MEFIKKMRKRENIEMAIKTAITVFACFLTVILMCGMIYSIGVNSFMKRGEGSIKLSTSTIAYCIEVEDDQYFVLYYNPDANKGETLSGRAISDTSLLTKEECETMESVKEVVFGAPPAHVVLDYLVKGWHIAIIAVVVAGVLGYCVFRFIKLGLDYKAVIKHFEETGEIEIQNA